MCRLLAYMGPEINLFDLILKPHHNLEKQAWQPKELREAKLNADGFGFGWYQQNGETALYRQSYPIWNDSNLKDLSLTLKQNLFFAMVRSATGGHDTGLSNTQPFAYKHWLFQHNGYILNFTTDFRTQTRRLLHHDYENLIQGNTDSEYIFALLMQHLEQTDDPVTALQHTFNDIASITKDKRSLLNIMLSDDSNIYASKHAINGLCPSLYYGRNINDFPENGQLLASESLNDDKNWQSVDDHRIIHLQKNKNIEIFNI